MLVGKMTVTFQDVPILFRLCMHGLPDTSTKDIDWHTLCEELLGVRPIEIEIRGASSRVRYYYPFLTLTFRGF